MTSSIPHNSEATHEESTDWHMNYELVVFVLGDRLVSSTLTLGLTNRNKEPVQLVEHKDERTSSNQKKVWTCRASLHVTLTNFTSRVDPHANESVPSADVQQLGGTLKWQQLQRITPEGTCIHMQSEERWPPAAAASRRNNWCVTDPQRRASCATPNTDECGIYRLEQGGCEILLGFSSGSEWCTGWEDVSSNGNMFCPLVFLCWPILDGRGRT